MQLNILLSYIEETRHKDGIHTVLGKLYFEDLFYNWTAVLFVTPKCWLKSNLYIKESKSEVFALVGEYLCVHNDWATISVIVPINDKRSVLSHKAIFNPPKSNQLIFNNTSSYKYPTFT